MKYAEHIGKHNDLTLKNLFKFECAVGAHWRIKIK